MGLFWFSQIFEGFLVKSIASFDDTLTRIPVISQLTRSKKGKVAFSLGTLIALSLILPIAIVFADFLEHVPLHRYIVGVLILLLAIAVYFDIFVTKTDEKLKKKIDKEESIGSSRFLKLVWVGFIVSFITLLDDVIVLLPLFVEEGREKYLAAIGVYAAALVQIFAVIYFGEQLDRFKYKKELASSGLVVLSFLIMVGVL